MFDAQVGQTHVSHCPLAVSGSRDTILKSSMSVVNSTADGLRRTGRLPALEHGLELPGGDAQSASEFDTARQLLSYLSGSVRNLDEALPQARPAPPGHRAPSHARHSRRLIHSGPVLSEIPREPISARVLGSWWPHAPPDSRRPPRHLERAGAQGRRAEVLTWTALAEARLEPATVYTAWCEERSYDSSTRVRPLALRMTASELWPPGVRSRRRGGDGSSSGVVLSAEARLGGADMHGSLRQQCSFCRADRSPDELWACPTTPLQDRNVDVCWH